MLVWFGGIAKNSNVFAEWHGLPLRHEAPEGPVGSIASALE